MARPELADIGVRLLAAIIDNLVVVGPMLCVIAVMAIVQDGSSSKGDDLVLVGIIGGLVLGLAVQLIFQLQTMQSVGKRILGIRVVCVDGSTPSLVRIVVLRNLAIHA